MSEPTKQPKVLFSLGRNGDLTNCLAIAHHFASGSKIPFAFSAQYTALMLGARNYVEPIPLKLSPDKVDVALALLKSQYESVVNLHTFGAHYRGDLSLAHNQRSWIAAGLSLADFFNLQMFPLVFDRSLDREEFLFRTHVKTTKPLVLISLGCSNSSPFSGKHVLRQSILSQFGHCEVVDLCRIKAGRLYDMLTLLERAICLITTDGSVMHLKAAVPKLPAIYLYGDNQATVAEPRYTPALRLKYSEAVRRVREIHGTLHKILFDRG